MKCRTQFDGAEEWETYFFEKNLHGDIVAVYDESGRKVLEYYYDAWGNTLEVQLVTNLSVKNPFRYRGYYYDTETELYYLNSRYYDAKIGRFINADYHDVILATGLGMLTQAIITAGIG